MATREQWTSAFLKQLTELRRLSSVERSNPAIHFLRYCTANLALTRAQWFQDLFVLFMLGNRREGFYVEFGACDGVKLSNTLLLEKLGWNGILAEPARGWHDALIRNRKAIIDRRCVYAESGRQVEFSETAVKVLSTITTFAQGDTHAGLRKDAELYSVETVSLIDLLAEHNAPKHIDFISVDTEGSELAILERFDFSRHAVDVWTVEHNFTENRDKIRQLMKDKGYENVFPALSDVDDWFVSKAVLDKWTPPSQSL